MSDGHVLQCPLTGQTSDFEWFFFSATRAPSHYCVKLIVCHSLVFIYFLGGFLFAQQNIIFQEKSVLEKNKVGTSPLEMVVTPQRTLFLRKNSLPRSMLIFSHQGLFLFHISKHLLCFGTANSTHMKEEV